MTDTAAHRALAVGYFNQTWELIRSDSRTPEQTLDMLTTTFASRRHWIDAGGADDNIVVGDWQVAHAVSLAGFVDVAAAFSTSAYDTCWRRSRTTTTAS